MNDSLLVLTLAGAVVAGTPLVLAAVGEVLTQRCGILNLGIEGMMLVGGVTGVAGTLAFGSPYAGLLAAMAATAVMGALHAFMAITLRVNQIVAGLALLIAGIGLSSWLGKLPEPPLTDRGGLDGFADLLPDAFSRLPLVGPLFLGHDPVVYASWLLVVAASVYLFRTRHGLAVRAVGHDPASADAAGLRVELIRYLHTMVGGALAGAGGAYLTIQLTGIWQDQITAGFGWIAFAMVSFSSWRPLRTLGAAYLFGVLTSLGFTLQIVGVAVPRDLLSLLPFVMTIALLVVVSSRPGATRRLGAPGALGQPYLRESR